MAWVVLIVSAVFESVWALALGRSDGFSRLGPSLVFIAALIVSMGGLAIAMRTLPTGTSYAVWVGIGATVTVVVSALTGEEALTWMRALLLASLVASLVGLSVTSSTS